jgi:hypothetical protein
MLPLCLCLLLAATPGPPVELRAGAVEPEERVSLDVTALVAPAHAEAGLYLVGRLGTPAASLRVLLLRSTDGGASWTEVALRGVRGLRGPGPGGLEHGGPRRAHAPFEPGLWSDVEATEHPAQERLVRVAHSHALEEWPAGHGVAAGHE